MIIARDCLQRWVAVCGANACITLPPCRLEQSRWGPHLVVGIMRQIWGAVEQIANPMPAIGPHNLEALKAYMLTDDVSHLTIPHPWLYCINCFLQSLRQYMCILSP